MIVGERIEFHGAIIKGKSWANLADPLREKTREVCKASSLVTLGFFAARNFSLKINSCDDPRKDIETANAWASMGRENNMKDGDGIETL